jgi:hypothetical protein
MKARGSFGGIFKCRIDRADGTFEVWEEHNLVPDVGVNYLINAAFSEASQKANWYIGLLNNYTPVAGSTMTEMISNEFSDFDETARQAYTPNAAATAKSLTNSSAPAVFTCDTDSSVVYGAFICSSATLGAGGSEVVIAAALFSSAKNLDDGDTLTVTYVFSGADDGA